MPKIAFLFLVMTGVHHEDHWRDFFRGHEEHYTVYVHVKEPMPYYSWFKEYELDYLADTSWANTMKAQILLLRAALLDEENQKFVFASDSTIPFRAFDDVYDILMAHKNSIFPYCSNVHQDPTHSGTFWGYSNYQPHRILHPIPSKLQYKNSQWIILNRKHAQLMAQDKKYIELISQYPCDNEHYPSTFLAIKGLLNDEVVNCQTTYDDWIASSSGGNPHTFESFDDENELNLAIGAIKGTLYSQRNPYLFGRKFAQTCVMKPLDQYLAYRWDWK